MVTGLFGPIAVRNLGRFVPIPFRSGRFGLGRFGPILQVGRFGPVLVGRFYFILCSFLGNKKFFLLGQLILCSIVSDSNSKFPDLFHAVLLIMNFFFSDLSMV